MKINLNLLRQPLGFSWRMAFLYRSWKDAAPNHRHYKKDKISRSDNAYFEIRVPQFIMPTFEKCLSKDISMDLKSWDWRLLMSMPTVAWCCVPIRLHLLEHWNISQDSAPPWDCWDCSEKNVRTFYVNQTRKTCLGEIFDSNNGALLQHQACIELRPGMYRASISHVSHYERPCFATRSSMYRNVESVPRSAKRIVIAIKHWLTDSYKNSPRITYLRPTFFAFKRNV